MKAFAVLLTLTTLGLVAPAVVMAYLAVFGSAFTDDQITAAFVLFFGGTLAGVAAGSAWMEVDA